MLYKLGSLSYVLSCYTSTDTLFLPELTVSDRRAGLIFEYFAGSFWLSLILLPFFFALNYSSIGCGFSRLTDSYLIFSIILWSPK